MSTVGSVSARQTVVSLGVTLLIGALLLSGCSSGSTPDNPVELGARSEAEISPTTPPSPRVIAVATPAVWPTPFATASAATNATRQPTAAPTRSATSTPAPTSRLPELARSLEDRLAALAQALAAREPDRALQAQRELLSEADRVETALQFDQSPQAELMRQALQDIRSGAAGEGNKLDSARAKLRAASGQPSSPADSTGSAPSLQAMAASLQGKVKSLNEARKERRVDALLRIQQELLAEISQDEKAIANLHSETADRFRSALQELRNGLSGEESKLESASTALQAVAGAPSQASAQPDVATREIRSSAASLDSKLAALREALSNAGRDQLLRAQRELLDELGRAEGAAQGNSSEEANHLRAAISLAREGAAGDPAKLEGARARLSELLGGSDDPRAETGPGTPPAQPADIPSIADNLSRKVDSYKAALEKGDRPAMLRWQQELVEQLNRDEQAVKGDSGRQADQLRSALADLRNALGGDLSKLNSANASLRLVAAGPEPARPSPDSPRQGSQEAQAMARDLVRTVDDVELALQSGNPEDLARARKALQQAEDAVQKLPPAEASALKSAIGAAAEALAGDHAKLEAARARLREIIPR